MLINLLPDFFAVLNSTDRIAAYHRYFDNHRSLLEAYWANYVVEPDSPHFAEVVKSAALAGRTDLRTMLERMDVVTLARNTEDQCRTLLEVDSDIDVVLMDVMMPGMSGWEVCKKIRESVSLAHTGVEQKALRVRHG